MVHLSDTQTGARILLVEDEPTNMAILSAYLKVAGYAVTEAIDGASAWDVLSRDTDFDVIVTDRRMPNMDGLELALQIKRTPNLKNIPIIMQTGATSQEEITEGVKAGVYYYLSKPYEEATLLAIVRSALNERQQKEIFDQKIGRQQNALDILKRGEFEIRTLDEAQNLALLLGGAFSRPELVVNGLYELLLNAIEHGNMQIGYEEKSRLVANDEWQTEVERRLALPENLNKKVNITFIKSNKDIEIVITDEGEGFDPAPFMEIEPSRATQSSGRGIAKANMLSFDQLQYDAKGNRVSVKGR